MKSVDLFIAFDNFVTFFPTLVLFSAVHIFYCVAAVVVITSTKAELCGLSVILSVCLSVCSLT